MTGNSTPFNHQAWGWSGDALWLVFAVGMFWASTAIWWRRWVGAAMRERVSPSVLQAGRSPQLQIGPTPRLIHQFRRSPMLEKLNDMPVGIDGLKATGRLSKEDYEIVVEPLLDRARRDGGRVRLFFEVGPEFEGFAASEGWEDGRMGLRYMRLFDACAIGTDLGWVRESTRLPRFMMPCPVRAFGDQERVIEWLSSIPEGAAISFHLQADSGVIVVELKEALRAHDFDALAFTADTWFEAHGKLRGVVIHCREFPGWENLRSVIRHVRFVRDHHRKVERVALAAESKLASLVPHIAEHFVEAEIKSFRFDELDAAIAWARGSGDQKVAGRVSEVETRA